MMISLLLALLSVVAQGHECPSDSFASVYEQKIYRVRHVTCLKKVKKNFFKHGPTIKYDFDGRILNEEFFFNNKRISKEEWQKRKEKNKSELVKAPEPVALNLAVHKVIRLYLPENFSGSWRASDPQVVNMTFEKQNRLLILNASKRGQCLLEGINQEGHVVYSFAVEVHHSSVQKPHVINGKQESIHFAKHLMQQDLLVNQKTYASIIPEADVESAQAWDPSAFQVIAERPLIRLHFIKPATTFLQLNYKGQKSPVRLPIKIE